MKSWNGKWCGVQYEMSIEPNAEYTLSFRYKMKDGNGNHTKIILYKDREKLEEMFVFMGKNGEMPWTEYTKKFSAKAATRAVFIAYQKSDPDKKVTSFETTR